MLKIISKLLVCVFLGAIFTHCSTETSKRPNIIIIMADDLGYSDLSCYGSKMIQTPNLDKLAAEGTRFTDFHSNGSVCSPTRASLLTGKYQQRVGIDGVVTAKYHRDQGLARSEITFAERFKEAGYVTGMFGKWHVGYQTKFNPIHQGFDEYIGYVSGNVDYHSHIDQEGYEDWWNGDTLKKETGYSTDLITKHSIDFMRRHKDEPFLLYIPHEAPHGPFQGRQSKAERFVGWKNDPTSKIDMSHEDLNLVYKEMVEVMDEGIGEVMSALKDLELDENTFVFFCSDNGGIKKVGSNGPLKGYKSTLWEGGHRVPAIAWYPSEISAGRVDTQTVLTMDIYPTLLDLIGAKVPEGLDGISIKNLLFKEERLPERTLFWSYAGRVAMRQGDWKLMLPKPTAEPMLYHVKSDISETYNVANEHPDMVQKMLKMIKDWEKDVKYSIEIN